ncbi:MAG: hypothetical protein OEU90_13685 [Gammaproteobacteria bacterium]|nr:hypothetical protein [Gammaproteobacteria bacterium]MDH3751031.1 hypothetical protein [Gammaproteobacteria bacterium]MDH3806506.1 hypothetical protein [Gammaproteobacteria bacterium]
MAKLRILTVFALFFGAFGISTAETLDMEGMAPESNSGRPTRGMTAASVESKFGAPQSKDAAVGDPPISRWEYTNFVVFFEYDRVIHAVVKRKTAS